MLVLTPPIDSLQVDSRSAAQRIYLRFQAQIAASSLYSAKQFLSHFGYLLCVQLLHNSADNTSPFCPWSNKKITRHAEIC